jgi:DNA mismatch repair protein MutS
LATRNRAFTLFATHYFELTKLADVHNDIANVHLDAVEYGEQLVFMHAVKEGPANRSFGLQVAALAGLPKAVIADAKATLAGLEAGGNESRPVTQKAKTSSPQLGLFAPPAPSPIDEAMRALDPDAMSPRDALDALYRLKKMSDRA